jgi:three-Cys-motif partner protein
LAQSWFVKAHVRVVYVLFFFQHKYKSSIESQKNKLTYIFLAQINLSFILNNIYFLPLLNYFKLFVLYLLQFFTNYPTNMNKFGGNWTQKKIEILVEYAGAYLTIMNKYAPKFGWKLLYFDGFAGSGVIYDKNDLEKQEPLVGAAMRILKIDEPCSFDYYYFVEFAEAKAKELQDRVKSEFSSKNFTIKHEDFNTQIEAMAKFLGGSKGKGFKVLAYIDPCGMQVNWRSLELLQKHSVDAWILVPTGMGVNRLLKNDKEISDAWLEKLEVFLGMERTEILEYFYKTKTEHTLFGEDTVIVKESKAIERSAELYQSRLASIFNYVSEPFVLKTNSNVTLFHFFMVSNNQTAVKISNQIIKKYNKL